MAGTGLFGSNVGGKAAQKLQPFPELKPMKPVSFAHVALKAAPKIHVSALHLTQAQMTAPKASSGSAGTQLIHGPTLKPGQLPAGQSAPQSGGLLGEITGGVEGFIGHLSSDIVHTAMGMPIGLVYLAEHPIAGAEGMVKATWADWSPLFHGNVDQFAHNFYAHPLAPILDLVGFATLGAGTAARVAGGLSKLGDAADAASIAGKLAKFSNPMKVATAENVAATEAKFGTATWANDGLTGIKDSMMTPEAHAHFTHLQQMDSRINHTVMGPAGDTMAKQWSHNPVTRMMEKNKAALGNKLTGVPKLGSVVGDAAVYKRWAFLDKGRRAIAASGLVERQITHLARTGELLHAMSVGDKVGIIHPHIFQIMSENSRSIRNGVVPSAKDLAAHDLQFLADPKHPSYVAKLNKIVDKANRMETRIVGKPGKDGKILTADQAHDVALRHYMGQMGGLHTTNKIEEAFHDAAGHPQVVSRTLPYRLKNEVLNSDKTLKQLYRQPIQVWRHMLLGLSPRYFVNNFIGNSLMLIAATDPVSLVRAFRNHVRMMHGAAAESDMMDVADRTMAAQQHSRNVAQITATPTGGGAWNSRAAQIRRSKAQTYGAAEERIAERHATNQAVGGNMGMSGREHKGLNPMSRHVGGEFGSTMSTSSAAAAKSGEKGLINQVVAHTSKGYRWTNNYADEPGRWMAAQYSLMRTPEYQLHVARLIGLGHSPERAALLAARDAMKMEGVRVTVAMQVKHMLGQYHTFHRFENTVKKNVVPFYSWYRALAEHVRHVVSEDSYKAAMGAALGAQGNKVQVQMLGQVPDFMNSMIPGALLGGFISNMPGRKAGINVATMSPYGTVADLTNIVMAATGQNEGDTKVSMGDTVGTLLNPVLQGAIEQITGASIQTGTPIKPAKGGIAGGLVNSIFSGLPQVKLLGDVLGTTDTSNTTTSGNPTLYAHGLQSDLSSFLGVPIRQVDQSAAKALAAKQSTKKKKPAPSFSFPGL
jgi:hypothetical protein